MDNLFALVEKGSVDLSIAGDRIKAQNDIIKSCTARLSEIHHLTNVVYLHENQLEDLFKQFFADLKEKRPEKIRALLDAFVESVQVIDPDTIDVNMFLSFSGGDEGIRTPDLLNANLLSRPIIQIHVRQQTLI